MGCPSEPYLSNEEFFRRLNDKALKERIPLNGGIDLTYRCNLKCVHCYAGPLQGNEAAVLNELPTSRIIALMDEAADAGCLNMLVTGGEPLLHKDFRHIYRHIKGRGMLATIFTNATLIDIATADFFAELPPYLIEVSIYGATEETSAKVTGVSGAFEKSLRGIRLLLDRGLGNLVRLKTVLMTLNSDEFSAMEKIASDLGLPFRLDAAIFPRLDGDKLPIALRVSPEEAAQNEFSSDKRLKDTKSFLKRMGKAPVHDKLYICSAGITNFHIDPYGMLQPCVMPTGVKYDLMAGSFMDGWNDVIIGIMNKKARKSFVCRGCDKISICGYCPAFFALETGEEDVISEYACILGEQREKILADE